MKFLSIRLITISISTLLFSACQKEVTNNSSQTNDLGNFTVTVLNRLQNQSKIQWNKPSNGNNSNILYKTYLNSTLISQNITDTFYNFLNLSPTQIYQGKVVAYNSNGDSSSSSFVLSAFSTANLNDSVFILSRVNDAGGLNLKFDYDTVNKRLFSWSKTYTASYDSTKVFYTPSGKVLSLVRKSTTFTPYNIVPNIYQYDGQNRVIKIYHKKDISTDESYSYMTTVSFPLGYDVNSFDSINYNNSNQVSSVYRFTRYYDNPTNTYQHSLSLYKQITYLPTNDSLPDKITTYTLNSAGGYDQSILNLNTYNNKNNPYYFLFKNFNLIGCDFYSRITVPTFLPYYYFGYATNSELTSIPYLCTNLGLTYSYNSDSLVTQCIKGQDISSWVRFNYEKVKK